MTHTKFKKHRTSVFSMGVLIVMIFTVLVASVFAADTTRPTIIEVSPANNELSIATHDLITVRFSELMDPRTINGETFTVLQRTTPTIWSPLSAYRATPLEGTVRYNGLIATFTPKNVRKSSDPVDPSYNPMQPGQEFGNVFTVTVTSGAKDLAGNSLARNYLWSFTTGGDRFNTNTGAPTSQLDQTPAAMSGVTVAPVTTTPTITARTFPWAWVIGGLLLLVLFASIFAATRSSRQKKNEINSLNPFGDVHPVIDIEGIGPEYNQSLLAMGIKNTKQLWEADAVDVASKTGAPLSSVKSWQNMAELATVKDIGPQYAELLERSGVHSIDQLKHYTVHKLLKLVRKKQNSLKINIQGNSPGNALVAHWIHQARDHKFSGSQGQIS